MKITACISSFWKHRKLILQLGKREVLGRYRGSMLGFLWSFVNPMLLLAVYTFVFSVVFEAKWGKSTGNHSEFALILFCGLIIFNIFAECINRAPSLILANAVYVKKVVFPLEILPWVSLVSSLFHALMSFAVLLAFYFILNTQLQWTLIFFPLVLVPLVFFIMGLSWFLASIGVFLRDISQVIGIITTVLLFMSPIFYPSSSVPEKYRLVIALNPLSFVVDQSREVVLWGNFPNWEQLLVYTVASLLIAALGLAWFEKTRKGFADVI